MKKNALLLLFFLCCLFLHADFIKWNNNFIFPSDSSVVNMSYLNSYDIDKEGFVYVKDSHFYTKSGRIKFFGTNLTFDSCFPDKKTAEAIAGQLDGLGINIVRIHHIDRKEIWGKYKSDFSQFDPDQLEKIDYLIYQLKKRGIYINLNLHVSWEYLSDKNNPVYQAISDPDQRFFKYGKGLDNFYPDFIDKQKKYASDILNHRNKYTNLLYKEDPVIAMIEINNENSLYKNLLVEGGIDFLPDELKKLLADKFQDYLKNKYSDFKNLEKHWEVKKTSIIENVKLMPFNSDNKWKVQITDSSKGDISLNNNSIIVKVNTDEKKGFFQLFRKNLTFIRDREYSIIMEIKGGKNSSFNINAMMDVSPWRAIGLNNWIVLNTDDYQKIIINFKADTDLDGTGRITLGNFRGNNDFIIKSMSFYEGRIISDPLERKYSFDKIKLPELINLKNYPDNFQADFLDFFYRLERNYWKEMVVFLKNDLKVKIPVTGTQIDYSYPDLIDLYDYADIHNYFNHPVFPERQWDGKNYYVKSCSMVPLKNNTFTKISLNRYKNKPYTVSEYNHPYPNLYNAESVTLLSVYSTLQDYDAIFYFNFFNGLDLNKAQFFGTYSRFICKSLYPFASYILRSNKVKPFENEYSVDIGRKDIFDLKDGIRKYLNPYYDLFNKNNREGVYFDLFKFFKISILLKDQSINYDISKFNDQKPEKNNRFIWENGKDDYRQSYFKLNDDYANAYIGWNIKKNYEFNNVELFDIPVKEQYFQFTLFNKDGKIGDNGRYVVTLSGRNYYTNVDYFDYDKKVMIDIESDIYNKNLMAVSNRDFNDEIIELIDAKLLIKLSGNYNKIKVYTINEKGEKDKELKFTLKGNELLLNLKEKSVIYCIEIF